MPGGDETPAVGFKFVPLPCGVRMAKGAIKALADSHAGGVGGLECGGALEDGNQGDGGIVSAPELQLLALGGIYFRAVREQHTAQHRIGEQESLADAALIPASGAGLSRGDVGASNQAGRIRSPRQSSIKSSARGSEWPRHQRIRELCETPQRIAM